MEQLQLPYVATEVAASATPATATIKSAKRKRVQRRRAKRLGAQTRAPKTVEFAPAADRAAEVQSRCGAPATCLDTDDDFDRSEFADRGALCAMSWSELDAVALDAGRESLLHVLTWRAWVLARAQAPARRPSGPHHTAAPRSAKAAASVAGWQQAAGATFEIAITDARSAAQVVRWRMSEAVRAMTEAPPIAAAVRGALLEVLRARARELTAARPWALEKTEVPSGAAE